MTICIVPECPLDGLIEGAVTGPDGGQVEGLLCFPHAYPVEQSVTTDLPGEAVGTYVPAPAVTLAEPAVVDDASFHVDLTAGLASMLLEHAAMALGEDDTSADDAMVSLAGNTAFTNDVAAGILVALTWIAAAGGVTADMLIAGAAVYEQVAEDDGTEGAAADEGDLIEDEDGAPLPACPHGCPGQLRWVDDQWFCPVCEDEWGDESLRSDLEGFVLTIDDALDQAAKNPDDDESPGHTTTTETPDIGRNEGNT